MTFSPARRTRVINQATRAGSFAGRLGRVEFAVYLGFDGVLLLIAEGKRWRTFRELTVWDALGVVERVSMHRMAA